MQEHRVLWNAAGCAVNLANVAASPVALVVFDLVVLLVLAELELDAVGARRTTLVLVVIVTVTGPARYDAEQ